jgi:hypothetical protein
MSQKAYRLMSALILANVLSAAAMPAAQASDGPGGPGDGTGRSHATSAPACGDRCPVSAGDGGPGNPGDNNSRSAALSAAKPRVIPIRLNGLTRSNTISPSPAQERGRRGRV